MKRRRRYGRAKRPSRSTADPRAEVRLLLRGGQGRRVERAARPARRQGLRAGRDDQSRHSRAAGLHHHDRGVGGLSRGRRQAPAGSLVPGPGRSRPARGARPAVGSGDAERPLLVSVRSGARVSMPGMMDTVLNLGLNDQTVEGLARWTKNERFAWDCYRRFITIFGDVVLGIERHAFDELLDARQGAARARRPMPMCPRRALRELVARATRHLVQARTGGRSRRIRRSSSGSPSTPSSTPGSRRRRSTTGASTGSPTTGAPR